LNLKRRFHMSRKRVLSESDGTEFTIGRLLCALIHGYWSCGWDGRKPLPKFAGVAHVYYDGHWYAARFWRFWVTIDPYPERT
jgi:hypothetical protein